MTDIYYDGISSDNTIWSAGRWKGDSGIGLNGQVDELSEHEWEAPAPYTVPLRDIQIRIRLFDQTSNQAREYTLTHDF